ncbi:MAG: acetyl-CoA carboxylase biotin carboxylase subunit [Pseudonocardiales bacterium]|nr:MAG: acetyl-CoA carboxylase biotin carboxylase subunit [Pseudonocardiales bacterium]
MFSKVLIANRGEIALRVLRTCQEMGIATVAVCSTEDRNSAVVEFADEVVQIGPAPARRSYLHIPALTEAALQTGADAVHPGYGFLSEDGDFAEVCESSGLVFVGPPSDVIRSLGNKSSARALMSAAGLPLLPGGVEPTQDAREAQRIADRIGYPVIIKAVAGGGGRGMSVVREHTDFARTYQETSDTAQALFGDGRVYVERYLTHSRHVEIQIFADRYGNVVNLGARDCTVQRRHQKLVEESPPPSLPSELVDRMGEVAVAGARAAGYRGAGTFEFLVDDAANFYFMEVNCRIQVEHPVTELVTGLDLVREQLLVAAGEPLSLCQEDAVPRGVAIECRINVEDPDRDFLPTPGRLVEFRPPGGPFVRVDTHGYAGYEMPATYDSLLAKLVVWAPTRTEALIRMDRALAEFRIRGPGVRTTASFLREVIGHPLFRDAKHSTDLVDRILRERNEATDKSPEIGVQRHRRSTSQQRAS